MGNIKQPFILPKRKRRKKKKKGRSAPTSFSKSPVRTSHLVFVKEGKRKGRHRHYSVAERGKRAHARFIVRQQEEKKKKGEEERIVFA